MNQHEAKAGAGNAATTSQPAAAAPHRVLLVEDNPGDARLIREFVREAGAGAFEVEGAHRLAEGLERLARGGIDLVLLDLSLPDSRGLATFLAVRARAPDVATIVLTGLNDETLALQAVHEGAQDYLVKGQGDGRLLVRAMRYAIERAHTRSQLHRYAEELRRKNAQMEADLEMAREIQQIFLPQQYPTFPPGAAPEQSALRFCHRYQPAEAIGGDFFAVFPLGETAAAVFICDVMGHGLRAALITAVLRGLAEELKPGAADAGAFLGEMNRGLYAILRRTEQAMMATAFHLVVDAGTGAVSFSSGGHPSPLHVQRNAGQVRALKDHDPRHGPALGLFEKSVYPTCHCRVEEEDLLMLFTDGLYEALGPGHEEFGRTHLVTAVRRRLACATPQLFDELLAEVRQFSGDRPFEDDVCLVGVERAVRPKQTG